MGGFLKLSLSQALSQAPGCGVGCGEFADGKPGFRKGVGQGLIEDLTDGASSNAAWVVVPMYKEVVRGRFLGGIPQLVTCRGGLLALFVYSGACLLEEWCEGFSGVASI